MGLEETLPPGTGLPYAFVEIEEGEYTEKDRIVKNVFRDMSVGCICPPEFPVCTCNTVAKLKLLTKKPIISSKEELEENPRARSAKLRCAVRL